MRVGVTGEALLILNLGSTWRGVVESYFAALPQKKNLLYPLLRRLGGPKEVMKRKVCAHTRE
jgi:hypothetical protein